MTDSPKASRARIPRAGMSARTRSLLVVALAVTSGATDAIGFLALGGAFTSVMTGNLVLMGVAFAGADSDLAVHTGAAIASFVLGAAAGARISGRPTSSDPVWPAQVTVALVVELALFGLYAAGWWATGARPGSEWVTVLLVLNACALGLQSSAVQRFGVAGLSTTYLTGTLTAVVIHLVTHRGVRPVLRSLWILLGLVGGAACGALLVDHARAAVPVLQLVAVSGVLTTVAVTRRRSGGGGGI